MGFEAKRHPLSFVFKVIYVRKSSGVLLVNVGQFKKRLHFRDGNLVSATSTAPEEKLGAIFSRQGKIAERQILDIERLQVISGKKIGHILVEQGIVAPKELFSTLRQQAAEIALSLFPMATGFWDFQPRRTADSAEHPFHIKVPELIREGVERITDLSFYIKTFSRLAPVTVPVSVHLNEWFSAEDIRFHQMLHDYSRSPHDRIMQITGWTREKYWRILVRFYLMNVLDFSDRRLAASGPDRSGIDDLYDQLKNPRTDYFRLLNIPVDADRQGIKAFFSDLADQYDPEIKPSSFDEDTEKKATYIRERLFQIRDELMAADPAEQTIRKMIVPARERMAAVDSPIRQAKKMFLQANELFEADRFEDAAVLLDQVIRLGERKPSVLYLLGLCQTRVAYLYKNAEANFLEVARLEPWNADPLYALGKLYQSQKLMNKAEHCFEKALEVNMEHTLAGRAMSEIGRGRKKTMRDVFAKKK